MNLKIDESLSLGYFIPSDIIPVAEFLNDIEVYNNTLQIPHPYTLKEAEAWVGSNMDKQVNDPVIENYSIRFNGSLIGGIGFMPCTGAESHAAEIGYWLAASFRGRGIMTKTVGFFCKMLFDNFKYEKLIAHSFSDNIASQIVLTKNGFVLEGYLRHHFKKEDQFIDCFRYGILKTGNADFTNNHDQSEVVFL
jgi:[ribosomal protein S5]-alanine N-acetyltransferase